MKKVKIDCDEWYPVYSLCKYGDLAELTDEDYDFVVKTFKDFDIVQEILRRAWKIANGYNPDNDS